MQKNLIDLTGLKFGKLTVIGYAGVIKERSHWFCICDCGNQRSVSGKNLKSNNSKSCGCSQRESTSKRSRKHCLTNSDEYIAWANMIQRCTNKNNNHYKNYGGRGIMICKKWKESFENFYADMGEKPSKGHSIDRINVNGNYEPSNCRWATRKEQNRNQRTNRWINVEGCVKTVSEWSERAGVRKDTIYLRLNAGWSEYEAVMMPVAWRRES